MEIAMPIYEYRCQDCGHELEKLQRMSDAPLVDCPACEKPGLKKLISAAAFRLKGSGWYETDFKKDGKRNLAGDGDGDKSAAKSDDKSGGDKKAGDDGKSGKSSDSSSGDKKTDSKSKTKDTGGNSKSAAASA